KLEHCVAANVLHIQDRATAFPLVTAAPMAWDKVGRKLFAAQVKDLRVVEHGVDGQLDVRKAQLGIRHLVNKAARAVVLLEPLSLANRATLQPESVVASIET